MRDVQCYELFGGIALKNHSFSFSLFAFSIMSALHFLALYMFVNCE